MKKINRSGDVNLIEVDKLPENLIEVPHKKEYITARGEATGSVHKLVADRIEDMKIMQDKQGNTYIQVFNKVKHTHSSDHETTFVLPAIYKQVREREKDWFQEGITRKVQD